jgi:drug/metabolite transporter (DMT)-like permease
VVVALYVWLFQKHKIPRREWAAIIITLLAVGLIALGGHGRAHQQSIVLGVISGFAFGAFMLVLKAAQALPPASIFFWVNLGAASLLLPLALIIGAGLPDSAREWFTLLVMGWLQLALGYYFFQRGLRYVRAVTASLISLIEPILNPVWVYLFFRELPPLPVIAGCSLLALALLLFSLPQLFARKRATD